jgi:hypothetical protein
MKKVVGCTLLITTFLLTSSDHRKPRFSPRTDLLISWTIKNDDKDEQVFIRCNSFTFKKLEEYTLKPNELRQIPVESSDEKVLPLSTYNAMLAILKEENEAAAKKARQKYVCNLL